VTSTLGARHMGHVRDFLFHVLTQRAWKQVCEHRYGGSPGSEPPSTVSKQMGQLTPVMLPTFTAHDEKGNYNSDDSTDYDYGFQCTSHTVFDVWH